MKSVYFATSLWTCLVSSFAILGLHPGTILWKSQNSFRSKIILSVVDKQTQGDENKLREELALKNEDISEIGVDRLRNFAPMNEEFLEGNIVIHLSAYEISPSIFFVQIS